VKRSPLKRKTALKAKPAAPKSYEQMVKAQADAIARRLQRDERRKEMGLVLPEATSKPKKRAVPKLGSDAKSAAAFKLAVCGPGAACAMCGGTSDLQAHHVLCAQYVRRHVRSLRLPGPEAHEKARELLYAPAAAVPICAADHMNLENYAIVFPRHLIPDATWEYIATNFGAPGVEYTRRRYPVDPAAGKRGNPMRGRQ
jgi:hypothetical protein